MLAGALPPRGVGRRLTAGLAQVVAPKRLGPDGEIDAWTLSFVDPQAEAGFMQNHLEQRRSCFRRVGTIILSALLLIVYLQVVGEDTSRYPMEDARSMGRWQLVLKAACFSLELSTLVAAVVLSGRGLIGPRAMDAGAVLVVTVANIHAGVTMRHYVARALGHEDPNLAWGVDLTGSDAPFLLYLILCVAGAANMVRWKLLIPLALLSVLEYAAAVYILGGPDMRLAPTNLLFFTIIVLMTCCGKRSSEFQARLLHLSYLREKQMRFRAEFNLECVRDHEDVNVEVGSFAGESSCFRQSTDGAHADGCVPLAGLTRGPQPSMRGAPAWLCPAATECPSRAGDGADLESSGCLALDASVWVEGRAESCSVRDVERGQRVLCYDSLGDCVDYVSVEQLSQDSRSLDWVDVVLVDGTRLKMTKDHPVQLAGGKGVQAQSVVPAACLQPGSHSIMVHGEGTRAVRVHSVSRVACPAEKPRGRAAVSVRQSARYSIFVAEGPGKSRLMAVGSADLAAPANLLRVGQSNTFLHASEEAPSREASAHSWPPSKRRYQHYSGLPGLGAAPPRAGASEHTPGGQEEPSWQSSRSNASERISSSSGSLPDDAVESVILPRPLTRLSDQLKAAAAGAPSLGSGGHFDGACRPCTFGHQGRCLFGVWCTSCHHQHFKVRGRLARLKPTKASSALPAIGPKSPAKQMLQ